MFHKTPRVLTTLIFLAMALFALVPQLVSAQAGEHGGNFGRAIGPITAIDTTASTLTIEDWRKGPVTLNVTGDTKIRLDENQNATLADLVVGDYAKASYNPTTMNAIRIDAKSPRVSGKISAIDANARTVTIEPYRHPHKNNPQHHGTPVTVNVTDSTVIERNRAPATFQDLTVGDWASASYNPQTMDAIKIFAKSK